MESQAKQVFQSPPKSAFSVGYDKGGFEPKMTEQGGALILGPNCQQRKNKEILIDELCLNHQDKRGSPYKADKTNEAKDLEEGQAKRMK